MPIVFVFWRLTLVDSHPSTFFSPVFLFSVPLNYLISNLEEKKFVYSRLTNVNLAKSLISVRTLLILNLLKPLLILNRLNQPGANYDQKVLLSRQFCQAKINHFFISGLRSNKLRGTKNKKQARKICLNDYPRESSKKRKSFRFLYFLY